MQADAFPTLGRVWESGMTKKVKDEILHDHNAGGIDRRGFLKCMAWAGTGALCVMQGVVVKPYSLSRLSDLGASAATAGELSFVQISDSHMGFNKPANPDVAGTLKAAVDKIRGLSKAPGFLLHNGDISHLSKPEEFDTVDQILKGTSKEVFFVPGEHDVLNDDGAQFRERYGKGSKGAGWYSFEKKGVHFIGLVNVMNLKAGGLGTLGPEQLEWLEDDVKHLKSSTPIVVFAHIPLWSVYPEWGWGTDDSAQALSYLKRFGSVSVLNGHIHQVMQKVEGNVTFHTAMSTAFPQPAPGAAPSPGPMKVEADRLRKMLGLASVAYHDVHHPIAITDVALENAVAARADGPQVVVDNFSFSPAAATVPSGATVTWTNRDDVPHNIVSTEKKFASRVLDTDQQFSHRFDVSGTDPYYCSIHPRMTGRIVVA